MKKSTSPILRATAFCSFFAIAGLLSSCDSDSESSENNSEPKTKEPAADTPASDLTSINGILTSEGEFVWALNNLIRDLKTKEAAEAAIPKIQEMKILASKIAEARTKFPALDNEKSLLNEYPKPIQRLAIGRQSFGFTLNAKKNHVKPVYEVIQPTLDEILEILPAPHQLRDGQ